MTRSSFLFFFCLTVLVSVGTEAQEAASPPPVEVGSADLVREEPIVTDVSAHQEPEADRAPRRAPSSYFPMPLPRSDDDVRSQSEEEVLPSEPVSFDLGTRAETYGGLPPASLRRVMEGNTSGSIGDWTVEGGGSPDQPRQLRNFSNLSFVSNPEDYPWRVAVKLFMNFEDTGGTLRGYVCSGTLIDPLHVLTAGHCVYSWDDSNNGWVFNDWADSIIVVPGFENGVRPYGSARAKQLHSYTGWTSDRSFDHDIGIIDLDRPIGAITGWHGYGWYGSCGSFTGGDFRHAGYPAASPFSGNWLYTNAGDYDSCDTFLGIWTGNEVRFNNQSWGGQSGSSSYQPKNSCPSCWVRSVLSNGTSSYTDDVRINEEKFNNIGAVITADTPGAVNLVSLDTLASPSSLVAGTRLSSSSFLLHNYSAATWNGTVDLDVYLSTNDFISTGDTFLGGYSWSGTLGPKGAIRLNFNPAPTIPRSVVGGSYFVGVIADISDVSIADNNTEGDDTFPLNVTGAPDLVVQSPSTGGSIVNAGAAFTLSMTVRNSGNGPSASSTLRYYRSTNSIISSIDSALGTDYVSALSAGGTSPESIRLVSMLPRGSYYFGGCVDAVPNEISTANCSSATRLTVTAPDLVVSSFRNQRVLAVGLPMEVDARVTNQGDGSSSSTTLRYYLSADAVISSGDTQLGTSAIGALASSAYSDKTVTLPLGVTIGEYWIGACVDAPANDQPSTNNCTVGAPIVIADPIFSDDFEAGTWTGWEP